MKKLLLTTVHEDTLTKIETSGFLDADKISYNSGIWQIKKEITDRKYVRIIFSLSNPEKLKLFTESLKKLNRPLTKEEVQYYNSVFFRKWIMFTAQDIIIYRILLSHFINYQKNGMAIIDLDTIHKEYRNKAFMYKSNANKYDDMTLNVYKNSISKLTSAQLFLMIGESKRKSFQHLIYDGKYNIGNKLIELNEPLNIENISTEKINYSIGAFGTYIMESYQYSQNMPKE